VGETECKVSERSERALWKTENTQAISLKPTYSTYVWLAHSAQIEMIFDPIPIKRKQTKHQTTDGFPIPIGAHQIAAESVQTKAKKELEDTLPTNRDYRTLNRMQIKFQNWRKLESGLDESDGKAMGEMLMANSSNLLSKNRTKKRRNTSQEFL